MADDATDTLPRLLAALLPAAGLGRVLAFAREHGGRRVSVPSLERLTDDHDLVRILGRDGAEALCRMHGRETSVLVPMGPAGTIAEARRRMARALIDGASIDEAAGAGGFHRRSAQRMRRRIRNVGQGDLF